MSKKASLIIVFALSAYGLFAQENNPPRAQYRLLSELPGIITDLSFSSNGLMLTFSLAGNIYHMDLKDGRPIQVTSTKFIETKPQWSPDGSKIAYQKDSSGVSSIWVYSTISKVHTRVTKIKENTFDPSWAPNGRSIAFSTDTYGSVDVMIKEFDYNKERRLTAAKGDEYSFGYHPGGKHVGYYERNTEEEDLYAVTLTGKEAFPLTRSTSLESYPRWSYDGSKVLFEIVNQGKSTIYSAEFPYGDLNRIAIHSTNFRPIISAKGNMVIYQSDKGEMTLYDMKKQSHQGLGLEELDNISQMCWSISGRIIAFTTNESPEVNKLWLANISPFIRTR